MSLILYNKTSNLRALHAEEPMEEEKESNGHGG